MKTFKQRYLATILLAFIGFSLLGICARTYTELIAGVIVLGLLTIATLVFYVMSPSQLENPEYFKDSTEFRP